eukprot:s1116_g9.t3
MISNGKLWDVVTPCPCQDSRRIAYFCPRTAFLLCEKCSEVSDLGQVTAQTCQEDLEKLKDTDPERCAVAAKRILGLCSKSQQARLLFLEAGICTVIAEATAAFDTFGPAEQDLPQSQALLKLLTRLAEWLYLAPRKPKPEHRVLVNVPENADTFSSAAHLYELLTGRRQKEPGEEDDDWQEAVIVNGEQEANSVQVQLVRGGNRINVTQLAMLPAAVPRGHAPTGVRLERHPEVEELLVSDADFACGALVLRERFLLRGPAELPPLEMFRPVPREVGTVEIQGEDGFPQSVIFDNEHLKLLFEFMNSEEVLAMQDAMHPASETFQSTSRVAAWLVEKQLPWLEGIDFSELSRLLRLFCVNSHPCKTAGNTSGLLKWGTMINHSCLPNVVYSSVEVDGDFEGHFRACRPIKKGEVLGVSYMKLQATLAPMALRRRMLWYLKGFVCLCCRCRVEGQMVDPARVLPCQCGDRMLWQYLPGFGQHVFSCEQCGDRANDEDTKKEKTLSSAVLGALCARWSGLAQAQSALEDLCAQVDSLHDDHFARRCLHLLFLALEADEFISSKGLPDTEGAGQRWMREVHQLGLWQERIRPGQHGGMLMMLSFKSVAPAIRLLADGDDAMIRDLMAWAAPVLSDRLTTFTLPEALPACVPLPKRANLPSPIILTQDWLMKHALPRNDLFLAKRVLMDRADLTAVDRQGNGVLAVAVEHQCSQEMVELLLEQGCPRTSKGPLGPPLAIAARCGRLEVVRVLLDYGCDPLEIEVSKHKLPEAAKSLLGYLVPKDDAVLQKGLPLRRLRRTLAVTLLPLARKMLPSSYSGQRNLDSQLIQVLVLGCEHAAPLPDDSLESLVQLCRSLLMSFDSSSMDLGLRLANSLCEAGPAAAEKLRRHGIFKMLPCLAATPELLHQPPRPQHIRLAAENILWKWSELISQPEPRPPILASGALDTLTPSELIRLEVPQKLLRERNFKMSKELAAMLLQVVEEEEKFSVHVYRERQDVSLRVLTEPFCLFCASPEAASTEGQDLVHGGNYVVQAEPLVKMGNLTRLLLVAGGFLGSEEYLRFCLRLIGHKLFQATTEYYVEGVVVLPQIGIPVHLLSASGSTSDNSPEPHVLALGDWHFEASHSDTSIERNEDVAQSLVNDYKVTQLKEVEGPKPLPLDPDEEELYMQLLHVEAKADVRKSLVKLCEQCCVAVVSTEDNEIVDAIAQSVDGLLIQEAAIPLLKHFGWQQRDMEEQEDASFTLWDPPDVAPVLNSFFHLTIQPPPSNPPGPSDPVWSVIIWFDAELPFELVWQSVELEVKNAFTSVSNKWAEIGWPNGEQEMLEAVHKAVAANGEAAVARGLTHSSATRIADRLMSAVACRVVAEPELASQVQGGSAQRSKGALKTGLRDLVEIRMDEAWIPAVFVQEEPPLYVCLSTGALATGKHRTMVGFEGPRLYPVPPVEAQVQTRADLQSLERGAESSRITRRFNVDADCPAPPNESSLTTPPGVQLPKPTLAYSLGGSSSSTSPSVSLLRGKDARVDGFSWVSTSWTTVGLPQLSSSGKVYYELHIQSHDTPQVGWASEKFRFFGDTWLYGVGDDLESWGVDGGRQKIWHGGEAGSFPSTWTKEVVVGCAADLPSGILQFSTNGVWIKPETFTGVQCASLYPAVSGQMTASFKLRPEEWQYGPPDSSYKSPAACAQCPRALPAPVRFPDDWVLAKGLQHLAERQKVDLLTTLQISCTVVLPSIEDLTLEGVKPETSKVAVTDASDELFGFVLDADGQPRSSEEWVEETLDSLGLTVSSAAGAALRLLWQTDADVQSPRLSAKLEDLCSHQVTLVSDSMPSWVLRLGTMMPRLFDRHCREVLLRSSAFGLPFAVHDRQTREVNRRYSEVMKAAEGRVAQAKNMGDQRALSQAYEHLFELTKQISQDPEVWIGSLTSELAKVDRERIWDQAAALAECCLSSSGVVEIQFKDETGFGRGVTQGFFSDVAKELQRSSNNSDVPMWAQCLESEGEFLRSRRGLIVQPLASDDPRLPEVLARFRALGRLLAIALRESFVVPLPLAATVLCQLRGEKVGSEHLPQPGDGLAGEFVGACASFASDLKDLSQDERRRHGRRGRNVLGRILRMAIVPKSVAEDCNRYLRGDPVPMPRCAAGSAWAIRCPGGSAGGCQCGCPRYWDGRHCRVGM